MIVYEARLDLIPGGKKTVVHLTQYSSDFQILFYLYTHSGTFTLETGTTAFIRGTKADGNGYSADAVVDAVKNTVTVFGDEQITAVSGLGTFELVLVNRTGAKVGTSNFGIWSERAALDQDTPASESKLREFVIIQDQFDEILAAGEQYAAFQQTATQKVVELQGTIDQKMASLQNIAAKGKVEILESISEVESAAVQTLTTVKAQILTEMGNQYDVTAMQQAANAASASATEAKKRASRAATYATEAEQAANRAAASASKTASVALCAEQAQTSAAHAATSAQLAADKAQEILALETGRRSGLTASEVRQILDQLVEQKLSSLLIPNGLLYDDAYLLTLAKDGVAIGTGVTVTGGGGGGSVSGGTWGSLFGL